MTRRTRAALSALLLAGLAGCGVDEQEELQMGRDYAAQIARELPLVNDPAVDTYITDLGRQIASRTDRAHLPWSFKVVNAAEVNAFAVPGGYIYVNRGLIERAERMEELAGVLGHEIGHVVLRHSAEQMEKQGKATGVVTLFCLVTGLCDGTVAQVAINVAGAAWFAKHSRADEAEADSAGIHAVVEAGISPTGIPTFFGSLLAERRRQPTILDDWFSSHPLEESRVARTEAIIAGIPTAELARLRRDSEAFHAFKGRLAALPRPAQVAPATP